MIGLLRNIFVKDLWPKLVCLVLAILIWSLVSLAIKKEVSPPSLPSGPTTRRTYPNIPVMILSSGTEPRSFIINPTRIEVAVRGEAKAMQSLQDKDIRAVVDVTDIADALDMRKRVEVTVPEGVAVVSISPEEVKLTILSRH
jgi:YbbR domain-containing protein